jgi:circadian clock protein KaiC
MELGETTKLILDQVKRIDPRRMVFDSLSEMRLLADESLRYRRKILALKQFFAGRNSTVLLLDDVTSLAIDLQLHSIAHGVITLDHGAGLWRRRRRLRVVKMRGIAFRGGIMISRSLEADTTVFPRLVAAERHKKSRAR